MPACTNEELLDLLVLGVTWVQRQSANPLRGLSGLSILQTMCRLGLLDYKQLSDAAHQPNEALRGYIRQRTYPIQQLGRIAPRPAMKESHNRGEEWLIAVVKPAGEFRVERMFTLRGYKLVATINGQRHALFEVAGRYAPRLTMDAFLRDWHTNRLRAARW